MKRLILVLSAALLALPALAEDVPPTLAAVGDDPVVEASGVEAVALPAPVRAAASLGDALGARATHRDFSPEPLTDQELADLLWAANGFNRPAEGKRTAPTAVNRQEIDLYVCRADGAWKWESGSDGGGRLLRVSGEDLRGFTGRMNAGADNFALKAPVALVYVVDFQRQAMQDRPMDAFKYAAVDCGFVGQNVYLHCAATGLHTVFLGMIDPAAIGKALQLPPTSVALFAQTVGRPAK